MMPRSHVLEDQVCSLFCESLQRCASGTEAFDWLRAKGAHNLVSELATENAGVLAELEATSEPTVAVISKPELLHFAAIMRVSESTEELLLRVIESECTAKFFPPAGIGQHYATALAKFHRGLPCKLPAIKPKGYEKFIIPYISYMCATAKSDREQAKVDAAASFAARNADRRYVDWIGLDGDGKMPVRWDFRMFALERTREHP